MINSNFKNTPNQILSEIRTCQFKKIYLIMSSAKRRPFCLGLNVLKRWDSYLVITKLQQLQRWSLGTGKFHPTLYNECD